MECSNTAAFGIFANRAGAETAVDQLAIAGFSNQDVSVLLSDLGGVRDFSAANNLATPEAATTGAGVGGIVGGTLGLLAGIGAFAIPGVGPLIVAGPLMSSLAALGVGGAVGGFVGAFLGMGIPEFEAKRYDDRIRDGGVLLAVHCSNSEEISKARDLLKAVGAEDIASCGEESVSSPDAARDRDAA